MCGRMGDRGCWRGNVMKYEEGYLRAYGGTSDAKADIARYAGFYNSRRPHRDLDGHTPDGSYFNSPPLTTAA